MIQNYRLREIDFLRGTAIILVLLNHSPGMPFSSIGWIGVDLFFVLSGFLISGLLFKEFLKYGKLDIKRFLVRRGFKIYPLFYITAIPYLILRIIDNKFWLKHLIGDLVFLQNYLSHWAYLYPAGWSLAVEEHFYLGLAAVLYFIHKTSFFENSIKSMNKFFDPVVKIVFLILSLIIVLRVISNLYLLPGDNVKNFSMTHLRIDSLLAGVLLSYFFYFKKELLENIYINNKAILTIVAFFGLLWVPFLDQFSFFTMTLGFTLIYLSFSIIILSFIIESKINQKLDSVFSRIGVIIISKIGLWSYSIYIIHSLVNFLESKIITGNALNINIWLSFFIRTLISIFLGYLLTKYIELFFLKIRNRYFPSRSGEILSNN